MKFHFPVTNLFSYVYKAIIPQIIAMLCFIATLFFPENPSYLLVFLKWFFHVVEILVLSYIFLAITYMLIVSELCSHKMERNGSFAGDLINEFTAVMALAIASDTAPDDLFSKQVTRILCFTLYLILACMWLFVALVSQP